MPGTTQGATTTLESYDPFDPAIIADPFPHYRLLQRDAPVYEVEKHGFFVISRYDDVVAIAQDWENFSTTWGPGPQRTESPVASILQSDPPQHTRLRSIISKAFTPRAVQACEPLVDAYARERVDALLGGCRLGPGDAGPHPLSRGRARLSAHTGSGATDRGESDNAANMELHGAVPVEQRGVVEPIEPARHAPVTRRRIRMLRPSPSHDVSW